MVYFDRLETNLKGLGRIDLGPKTLISARCGKGKSAVLEAISLALLGGVPDLEGRAWTSHAGLLCASLGDANGSLWVKLHRTDGLVWSWSAISGRDLEWKQPELDLGGNSLAPLIQIDSAISGSDEKAYAFLLRTFKIKIRWEDVEGLLGADFGEMLAEAPSVRPEGPPLDALAAARDEIKSRLGESRRMIRTLEVASNAPGVIPPLVADFDAAQEALDLARAQLAEFDARPQAEAVEAARERLVALRAGYARQRTLVEELKAKIEGLEQESQAGAEIDDAARGRLASTAKVFEHQIVRLGKLSVETAECPMCAHSMERASLLDVLKSKVAGIVRRLEGSAKDRALRARLEAARTDLARAESALEQLQLQGKEAKARYGKLEAASSKGTARADQRPALVEGIRAAQAQLNGLVEQKAEWRAREGIRSQATAEEARAARLGPLLQKIEATMSAISRKQVSALQERMNTFLPPEWPAAIEEKPFRIGLRVGDRRLSASGAQRNALLLAIGAVAAESTPGAVLLPAERAYDSDSLRAMMQSLEKATPQVVITTPPDAVPEDAEGSSGWTVVEVTLGAHPAATDAPVSASAKPPRRGRVARGRSS